MSTEPDDRMLDLLIEEVRALRGEVRELRDEFQQAKGSLTLIKWLAGISIAVAGLWHTLRGG